MRLSAFAAICHRSLVFALLLPFRQLSSQSSPPPTLTTSDWREDLRFLATELPRRHANAFHDISRQQFERMVSDFDDKMPGLDADAAVVGLSSIAAAVGDGHTAIRLPADWPRVSIVPAWYGCYAGSLGPCELRITSAAPGSERAIGARVLAIDGTPVADVHLALTAMIPKGESDGAIWASSTGLLQFPNVLHGLGLVKDPGHPMFELEDSAGTRFTLTARTVPRQTPVASWATAASAASKPSLTRQHPGDPFWWTMLADSQTAYVAFDAYPDVGRLRRLTADLMRFLDERHAQRLVIDLRRNQGGDYTKVRGTLLPAVAKHPLFHKGARFYVLIGPYTFSAAMTNAVDFRKDAGAILVGLPTGARPNGYQEGDEFRLPHSGLIVGYSTKLYKFQDEDTPGVMPDTRVEPTWASFKAGRDVAIEWVLAQPLPPA